eukprot:1158721-Pelagomonas_calceolata.AAC.3
MGSVAVCRWTSDGTSLPPLLRLRATSRKPQGWVKMNTSVMICVFSPMCLHPCGDELIHDPRVFCAEKMVTGHL